MRASDEDGFTGNTVHVYANAAFDVVNVDVAILRDEIDDVKLRAHLHSHRKVILRLWREENVNLLLWERLVACWWLADFDDVQLEQKKQLSTKTMLHRIFG